MHRSRLLFIVMGLLFMTHEGLAGLEVFVYPSKGQTKEQQEQDEFACYKWAKEQTGIDPNQVSVAAAPPPPESGQVAKGAARGAAVGAIGGAIGGDAGKGAAVGAAVGGGAGVARRRRSEMQYQESVKQSSAAQQQKQQEWNRAYGVCLSGKGYKVG